jgi:hypothetical protein
MAISSLARAAGLILAATILFAAGAADTLARDWTSPRKGDEATRSWERSASGEGQPKAAAPKRTYTHEESSRIGAEIQRRAEARQRGWDAKMKAMSGSICSGC